MPKCLIFGAEAILRVNSIKPRQLCTSFETKPRLHVYGKKFHNILVDFFLQCTLNRHFRRVDVETNSLTHPGGSHGTQIQHADTAINGMFRGPHMDWVPLVSPIKITEVNHLCICVDAVSVLFSLKATHMSGPFLWTRHTSFTSYCYTPECGVL
jgi:hypothetical protein